MWECPDFFPVSKTSLLGLDTSKNGADVKHVLKVSLKNKDIYTIGTYNVDKDIYIPDKGSVENDSGFRYDDELEKLRTKHVPTLCSREDQFIGVTPAQADVGITFEMSDLKKAEVFDSSWTSPQTLCSKKGSSLNQDNDMTTYGTFVNVDPLHEKLSLRSLIDHSIVESFGGLGKSCITARVYPTLAVDGDTHLYIFNYGSESVQIAGDAWSLKTAKIN
ncbi:hypothetical protein ACLB2K_055241 [Fragaria x ananassa]